MLKFHVAIIERAKPDYSVFFPDIPGCTNAGATIHEAAANAEAALQAHLTLNLEHGEASPEPTALDAIAPDPDIRQAARVLIRFDVPGRAIRGNITMPEDLLEAIDRFAKGRGYTRSSLLALAAREHIKA